MASSALDEARRRIAPCPAAGHITEHLRGQYGIDVSALTELDLGVYRVDRANGPAWVARVFPAVRPASVTATDAQILRVLEENRFPAERVATVEPLSVVDDQTVLVTEFVPGVPRAHRAAAIRAGGGLRRLGEMLGQLHALPPDVVAAAGQGGAWHHLADGHPRAEVSAALALLAECAETAAASDRPHCAALQRELAGADAGDGLPDALIHPDFVLANVIAAPDRGMVLVDWSGAGRGPRAWPLAFLLFAEAAKNPPRARLVVSGYRRQVTLQDAEIERIPAMMRVRPVVLAAWSYCLGRQTAEQAARAAASARHVAEAVGPQVVAAFRERPD